MRMWHVRMISALPREQLVAQWRELSAIAGNILTKGTPNHILVNKVMDYSLDHFITYSAAVRSEMTARGYKTMDRVWDKIVSVKPDWKPVPTSELYNNWMNYDYWLIGYYNLKEKYMCGGITDSDWKKINNKMNGGGKL